MAEKRKPDGQPVTNRTAGLLLAAGRSTRMVSGHKLLKTVGGVPLVRLAAMALLNGGISPVVAVTGHEGGAVAEALKGLGITITVNPDPASPMSASLIEGLKALPNDTESVAVMPGDMPAVRPETVSLLISRLASSDKGIILPLHNGRRGHPVIFRLDPYREKLMALKGDQGGREIIKAHPEDLLELETGDPGILIDIDTDEDLFKFSSK